MTTFELWSFISLNWLKWLGILVSNKENTKNDANIHLSIIFSKGLSFNFFNFLLFSSKVPIMVFVTCLEVSLIVLMTHWIIFFTSSWEFCFPNLSCTPKAFTWCCSETNSFNFPKLSFFLFEYKLIEIKRYLFRFAVYKSSFITFSDSWFPFTYFGETVFLWMIKISFRGLTT